MIGISIHGIEFVFDSDNSQTTALVAQRFEYFKKSPAGEGIRINCKSEMVDLAKYESLSALGVTPRNFFYKKGIHLFADYFGKAFSIHNLRDHSLTVYCDDPILAYEIVYLFILSQAGTLLEKKGFQRVHGLGFDYEGRGILILLPSGGGKSSLALRLIKESSCNLVSEDAPLLGPGKKLYSLPLGIGIDPKSIGYDIPEEDLMVYKRMEYSQKTVLLSKHYQDRVSDHVPLKIIMVGTRILGSEPRIVKVSRFALGRALLAKMVVGLGLFQGIEYLLHRSNMLRPRMAWMLFRRSLKMIRLLTLSRRYRFYMSYDYEKNFEVLQSFLASQK